MRPRACLVMLSLCCVGVGHTARGEPATPALELAAVAHADPLALARAADRLGDPAMLSLLGPAAPVGTRWLAVAATPYLAEPEAALPSLAALALGRDPDLAPLAAVRALAIAKQLARGVGRSDEWDAGVRRRAVAALSAVAASPRARADIRLCCEQAAALLRSLLVP